MRNLNIFIASLCKNIIFLLFIIFVSNPVLSNELVSIESTFPIQGLSEDEISRSKLIINRFKSPVEKNRSCPLNSNNYKDIVGRIKTIRNLFKDNCLDSDQSRLDAILSGAQSIQNDLNSAVVNTTSNQTVNDMLNGTISTGKDTTISGEKIASVLDNINSIFLNGKCDLNRGSFLVQTADVIQSFATMGMLVPNANGLIVAGGGLAFSSILRAIDAIFADRFNFSDDKDRQTFIKLNCAFYDLRQDIQRSGLLDVSTEEYRSIKFETKLLISTIEAKIKAIIKNKKAIEKSINIAQKTKVTTEIEKLISLGKIIDQSLTIINKEIMTSNGMPVETIKLKIINNLTRLYPLLSNELQVYFASGLNSILILDEMLLFELNKLDHQNNSSAYQQLLKQDENSFETGFRANLLFHFMRIKEDILYSKEKIEKEFMKNNSINGLNLFAYKDDLEKRTKKLLLELVKMSKPLKTSFQKLQNITSDGDYSSSDEGSENVVAILSQYEEISLQVYGKWGYEFLEYTTDESEDRNDDFIKKFNKFAKDHLSVRTNSEGLDYYQIIAPSDLSELRVMYACQDAMPFRRIFKHSDALVQQGHDFVETNKRLFHSDVPQGLLGVKSKFRHIQNHHKSSIFAKKIINGETVAQKYIDKYINKTYTSKRKKYLGKMMIKIHNSRKKATLLQTLIDRYNCNSITLDEK